MNKSTILAYQKHFSSRLSRRFPPFLAVRGGQTEREPTCLNVKLHAARFRVCVSLAAHMGVLLGGLLCVGGKPLLQGGVVGAKMDKGIFLVKPNVDGLFLLGLLLLLLLFPLSAFLFHIASIVGRVVIFVITVLKSTRTWSSNH